MEENNILNYVLNDLMELNLSYMPFITGGALFIPTEKQYTLGDKVIVDLQLSAKEEKIVAIEGKVIWITPKNALHHVIAGIGIQFEGDNAKEVKKTIESYLDKKIELGGYTYGIS